MGNIIQKWAVRLHLQLESAVLYALKGRSFGKFCHRTEPVPIRREFGQYERPNSLFQNRAVILLDQGSQYLCFNKWSAKTYGPLDEAQFLRRRYERKDQMGDALMVWRMDFVSLHINALKLQQEVHTGYRCVIISCFRYSIAKRWSWLSLQNCVGKPNYQQHRT